MPSARLSPLPAMPTQRIRPLFSSKSSPAGYRETKRATQALVSVVRAALMV